MSELFAALSSTFKLITSTIQTRLFSDLYLTELFDAPNRTVLSVWLYKQS